MTRDELQRKAAEFLEQRKRVICQWATGIGKSGVVLNFVKNHLTSKVLILVPEQNNIQNWRDEFTKFLVPDDNVTIACYASLHKFADTKWSLIVFDEAPHIDTEKRLAVCSTIKADYVLALGAVISDEERDALYKLYGSFLSWRIPLHTAISWGLIPAPTINVCHLQLDDTKREFWHKGLPLTARKYYDVLQKKVENAVAEFNKSASKFNKQKMLYAGSDRKRFLGAMKEVAAQKICKYLEEKDKRFLCFCSSIDQAQKLGGDKAFTSETPVSMKVLERFNAGELNSLYVVGKLIEGQNLKNIECGVIVQLGGTHRITVQEIGRILRSENPVIYVPVFDGTKDDKFLITLTDNIPDNCIKHYNF